MACAWHVHGMCMACVASMCVTLTLALAIAPSPPCPQPQPPAPTPSRAPSYATSLVSQSRRPRCAPRSATLSGQPTRACTTHTAGWGPPCAPRRARRRCWPITGPCTCYAHAHAMHAMHTPESVHAHMQALLAYGPALSSYNPRDVGLAMEVAATAAAAGQPGVQEQVLRHVCAAAPAAPAAPRRPPPPTAVHPLLRAAATTHPPPRPRAPTRRLRLQPTHSDAASALGGLLAARPAPPRGVRQTRGGPPQAVPRPGPSTGPRPAPQPEVAGTSAPGRMPQRWQARLASRTAQPYES
jgi:hypothetical protein